MAGYRPKSLDELNSLYDKSTNAKNEIYKKASDLEVKGALYSPVTAQVSAQEEPEKSREEAAAEEISGLVGDFIKSFGTPAPIKKVRPVTVATTPVKSVSSVKDTVVKPQSAEKPAVQPGYAPVSEKPRLIRSDERNELFEDYKKVMDDDGEEENSRLRRGRRKGKKLFEKKNSASEVKTEEKSQEVEVAAEEAVAEISYEGLVQETAVEEPEIPETLENIDAVIEKVLGKAVGKHVEEAAESPAIETVEEEAVQVITDPVVIFEAEEDEEPAEEIAEVYPEEEPEAEIVEVFTEEPEEEPAPVEEVIEEPVAEEEPAEELVPAEEGAEELAPLTEASVEEYISILDEVAQELSYEEQDTVEEILQEETSDAEAYEEEAVTYEPAEDSEEAFGYEEAVIGEHIQSDGYADEKAEPEVDGTYYVAPVKKRYAGKNILLILIFLVLLLATAVSAVKAFSGINSDTLHLDKYYLFTAESSFEQAGINKGDLVVVSHEDIKAGDVFAFSKGDGEYGFARFESELNEESIVADTDGQKSIVFKNTLRGVFFRTYPVIGTVAALIMSQYLYVVGALFLVAAILLLIVIFAFRTKKAKAPKKSKKKEEATELEDVQEEEAAVQEQTSDNSVDDDFKYLIQDDGGDDFDVYRKDYSDDETLPVYQADDYKYEPDEYVNN